MESGVYRAADVEPVSQAAQRMRLALARIRFGDKETLLRNFAAALGFPAWSHGAAILNVLEASVPALAFGVESR